MRKQWPPLENSPQKEGKLKWEGGNLAAFRAELFSYTSFIFSNATSMPHLGYLTLSAGCSRPICQGLCRLCPYSHGPMLSQIKQKNSAFNNLWHRHIPLWYHPTRFRAPPLGTESCHQSADSCCSICWLTQLCHMSHVSSEHCMWTDRPWRACTHRSWHTSSSTRCVD